ncbi:type IV toxin-antitoxin system AbiEi family antitoxin domain-containing protein [Sinomonas sp. G460-2]|uniref:type IV toxin-antitoxin system AbiEi family antitoxin domain-containing protein n=1 Tax=Sinomonas sp. G460-2 TaxID=3393464 RepID=UPI0039F0C1F7
MGWRARGSNAGKGARCGEGRPARARARMRSHSVRRRHPARAAPSPVIHIRALAGAKLARIEDDDSMETRIALTAAVERWPGGMIASTSQLIEAGIDDRVISACVRAGVFDRIRRGAYCLASSGPSWSPRSSRGGGRERRNSSAFSMAAPSTSTTARPPRPSCLSGGVSRR